MHFSSSDRNDIQLFPGGNDAITHSRKEKVTEVDEISLWCFRLRS